MGRDDAGEPDEGRLIAIGDIHGCSSALRSLIEAIDPRPEDTIVTLGDCIDWGPDSRGVVDLLIGLSRRCHLVPLLGNHEEMMLAALESASGLGYWRKFGGEETMRSYGRAGETGLVPADHVRFIKTWRHYYETVGNIFTHANYEPEMPIHRTGGGTLRWEHIDARLARPHRSGKTVVVGHTPQREGEVLDLGFLVCLDTDCSRGGWLTALDVKTRRVVQANQEGDMREAGTLRP